MSRTAPTANVMPGSNTGGVSVGGGVGQQVVPGAVSPVGGMNPGNNDLFLSKNQTNGAIPINLRCILCLF